MLNRDNISNARVAKSMKSVAAMRDRALGGRGSTFSGSSALRRR